MGRGRRRIISGRSTTGGDARRSVPRVVWAVAITVLSSSCCVGSVAAVSCNGFVDEGRSAVVTRRFGKDANGLWKVCVARPENVGTHGCTHGEHVDNESAGGAGA